ncbi:MAG: lipopolysaccharide heptosyltransferase II [Candidatus Omnitrophica bacterium]|nr:lipopolysaccharide heptosyltransferase II [Candidatus Omnitrophota bacterium]
MKVLQVLPSLEVGGVERGVLDLARAMKKRGDETVVISSGGELVAELEKINVRHYKLPVDQKSIFSLSLVGKIAEIIEKERIEVVHGRSRVPAWLAWLASRRMGVPFVTTCHGYYSTHALSRIMGWGKRVIVISSVVGRHMIDHFGVPPERIRLIHRGIDFSQFPYAPGRYDETPKPFRIINVARLSPIKGQLEFLKAIHLLRRQIQHLEIWIVGAEGRGKHKYTDLLKKTIHQLGLESTVKLLGTRRDVADLMAQSDLVVLSTLIPEAFGRVVVEAGAVGRAVLATRVGGVLDIIDHEENGILVMPGNIEEMAERMHELLTDRQKAKRLAENLKKKVESRFTLEQMMEKTLQVYQEVRRYKNILIIKLGAAGDLILAVPSFRMIRQRFPDARISLLVDKRIAPLVSECPYLDEIIPVDRKKVPHFLFLLKLAKRLRREAYDISVDLQNSKWTHLAAFLAGIPQRFGFARGGFGYLLNRPDRNFGNEDEPVRHQFRILSKLGVKEFNDEMELWPDSESQLRMGQIFDQADPARAFKWVGLVLGSSPQWQTKRWPMEHFSALADLLIKKLNCRIVLLGSKEDQELVKYFQTKFPERVIDLVGKTSLGELAAVMPQLDVLVTGDTSPLHVAGAMKTKIVAIFGPTDPRRHMPPGSGSIVLNRHLPCQPCYDGTCHNQENLACLKRISVTEVFEAVERQFALRTPASVSS